MNTNNRRNLPAPRLTRQLEPEVEDERPYLPRYEQRRDLSLLIPLVVIFGVFVVVAASVLFIVYSVTNYTKLPSLAAQFVGGVQGAIMFAGTIVAISAWLFIIRQGAGTGEAIAKMVKAWIHAIGERERNKVLGMNATHVVVDGRSPVRIESTKERSEHYHYGGEGKRGDTDQDDTEEEPLPRPSQHMRRKERPYDEEDF